jgi:cytochrome c biogenesis protein CcdA
MKIFAATLTVLLGLFILASAVAGVIHRPGDWKMIVVGALMGVIGITTIRVAGYMLRPVQEIAHSESRSDNS